MQVSNQKLEKREMVENAVAGTVPAKAGPAKAGSGIREFCEAELQRGELTVDQIAEAARAKFGGATSVASVRWYKSKMKVRGQRPEGAEGEAPPVWKGRRIKPQTLLNRVIDRLTKQGMHVTVEPENKISVREGGLKATLAIEAILEE